MPLPVAVTHQRRQDRTILDTLEHVEATWTRMSAVDLDASWERLGPGIVLATAHGQHAAATEGAAYIPRALSAQGIATAAAGAVEPAMLTGIASDGRPLGSLLYGAVATSGQALNAGAAAPVALRQGWGWLQRAVSTQVADAGRVAEFTGMVARPQVTGYVRMVNPGACARCIILAGRTYKVEGFERHPACRCVHVPSAEDSPGDIGTDPQAYFDSLSPAEQDRTFTKAGAQAIRDGADMSQVVNARRGMYTAQVNKAGWRPRGRATRREVYGHRLFTTDEGTTRRGHAYRSMRQAQWARDEVKRSGERYARLRAPRLMPESIYEVATDRADAIRLLRLNGYIH